MFQFSLELPPACETLESCDACSNKPVPFCFRGFLFFLRIVEIDVQTEKGYFSRSGDRLKRFFGECLVIGENYSFKFRKIILDSYLTFIQSKEGFNRNNLNK